MVSLNLKGCHRLTDKALGTVARFTTLTSLDISMIPRLTSEGLCQLSTLKSLEELRLTGCRLIKTEGIAHLALPNLRVLDIRATGVDMTREDLMAGFTSLQSVAVAADMNLVVRV